MKTITPIYCLVLHPQVAAFNEPQQEKLQRHLSELGGCPRIESLLRETHFAHIFRSFSANSYGY